MWSGREARRQTLLNPDIVHKQCSNYWSLSTNFFLITKTRFLVCQSSLIRILFITWCAYTVVCFFWATILGARVIFGVIPTYTTIILVDYVSLVWIRVYYYLAFFIGLFKWCSWCLRWWYREAKVDSTIWEVILIIKWRREWDRAICFNWIIVGMHERITNRTAVAAVSAAVNFTHSLMVLYISIWVRTKTLFIAMFSDCSKSCH